jgi:hypothetical protein
MAKEIAEPNVLAESPALDSARHLDPAPANEEIASLAYSLWEARGGIGGSAEEDWLAAEAELRRGRTGFDA